ncbi:unnamed protein product [Heligmosomoides polygyrus]|uniref:Peptidase S1 domain-containing protein n=1 Tax=Heligmosomoides polygyrus TaxID=6339 RepID=A0A183FCQ8_HELPZ|nr:unnamed protein product [Heligmosomoides polygyrus]
MVEKRVMSTPFIYEVKDIPLKQNAPLTLRDQKSFGRCLSDYTNSEPGQKCISAMAGVDPMASDASTRMCDV